MTVSELLHFVGVAVLVIAAAISLAIVGIFISTLPTLARRERLYCQYYIYLVEFSCDLDSQARVALSQEAYAEALKEVPLCAGEMALLTMSRAVHDFFALGRRHGRERG